MPQVDLEALVCGLAGGDARVACETQIVAPYSPDRNEDPDLPPESITVPVGGFDWAEVTGAVIVYERDDSTKGSTNPKAQKQQQQHGSPIYHPKPLSTSQRFSKPPTIRLPAKIQHHSGRLGRSARRPANALVFPKNPSAAAGGSKSAVPVEDPGSPKVSCIGRILPEREREQCRRSPEKESTPSGFWASVSVVFCCWESGTIYSAREETKLDSAPAKVAEERANTAETEPPMLGSMRRFASGRGAADLYGDMEAGPLPLDLNRDPAAWASRRPVGPLADA